MKAFERAIIGRIPAVDSSLIIRLRAARVEISIQQAENEDCGHVAIFLKKIGLPEDAFGRGMDNNNSPDDRFSSNGYFFAVPLELRDELAAVTKTKGHLECSDGWRVAGLSTCLRVLMQMPDFPIRPIKSEKSARRHKQELAVRMLPQVLPMYRDTLAVAYELVGGVKPSYERQFPRGKRL